jgi:hypothetical protein
LKATTQKTLIGRTDIADFPNLSLFNIDVKVDTGAYTSSLHCHHIVLENGILKCQLLDPNHQNFKDTFFEFAEFSQKKVKSSNGQVENRFLIKTDILIFNTIYPIELTLTERGSMKFPVLLGRKFLTKNFVVDTSKKNLSHKNIIHKID